MSLPTVRSSADEMSLRYRLFRRLMIVLSQVFFGFTVHGGKRAHASGSLVVAANHQHFFDPVFVCMVVPRRVRWMGKQELFTDLFARFFYFIGSFPIDREGGGRSGLRAALRFLSEGWPLGIFPEGTRRKEGVDLEAKSGAIMLAVRGGARILPVYLSKPPGLAARLRGEKLHAYVGEPITIDNTIRGKEQYREAADEVLRAIYALPKEKA